MLKTGDPASARDRMQLCTEVAALALAAGQILDGWRQATGREPEHVAYWDVVAA